MNLYVHHFSLERKEIILNAKEDPIDRNVIKIDNIKKRENDEEDEGKNNIRLKLEGAKEISKEINHLGKVIEKEGLGKKREIGINLNKKEVESESTNLIRVDSEKGECEIMVEEGKIKLGDRGMDRLKKIGDQKNVVEQYIDSLSIGKEESRHIGDTPNAELRLLGKLSPGDLITVSSGADQIIAVGIIAEPGYEWVSGEAKPHCIHVDWKAEIGRSIPIQTNWPNRMIHPIKPEVFRRIVEDDWPTSTSYTPPSFEDIVVAVWEKGMSISERTLRRYHQSLETGKFVILSGLSGTGKTWLTELYANAVGAKRLCQPVSPNWNTDEDLLGYHNPVEGQYHHTDTSRFLQSAEREYMSANASNRKPRPYHLVLDEMNLARVEHYFAKLLSKMEERKRQGAETLELGPQTEIRLTPNLFFVGTVNIDETTHEFADKVYDRAQLIEMKAPREQLIEEIEDAPYSEIVVDVWDAVSKVAPFGFRVLNEIQEYTGNASNHGGEWKEALDEQLLQKVLVKVKGTKPEVKESLEQFMEVIPEDAFPLSHQKADKMLKSYEDHGFASYF